METTKALIFTIAQNGYGNAYLQCISSQREYARRIGATFVVVNKPQWVSNSALSAWLKIPLMKSALQNGYDWVAYIDADCAVRSTAPDFRKAFDSHEGSVFMALGRSGRLNSGVMFARRDESSVAFYSKVLASLTEVIPAEDRASLKYENGNVIYVNRIEGGVSQIDTRWNNTFDAGLDDHIRHYTGPLRASLKRSVLRELQWQVLKKISARRLARSQHQPSQRDVTFREQLENLEAAAQQACPRLVGRKS